MIFVLYDDCSVTQNSSDEEELALAARTSIDETIKFDHFSGQKTHPVKSLFMGTNQTLRTKLQTLQLGCDPVRIVDGARLVGAWLQICGNVDTDFNDGRALYGCQALNRIACFPGDFDDRARLAGTVATPRLIYGSELVGPSREVIKDYTGVLLRALLPRALMSYVAKEVLWTVSSQGHRLEPGIACAMHTLITARRQLQFAPQNVRNAYTRTWHALGDDADMECVGIVNRLRTAVDQIGLWWVGPWHLKSTSGATLPLIGWSTNRWLHDVRMAYRQNMWRK